MPYLAFINNLGTPELVIIFIVVLILFGPKNIPKLARALGRGVREFKDATDKVTESITNLDDEDAKPVSRVPRGAIDRVKSETAAADHRDEPAATIMEPPASPSPSVEADAPDDKRPAANAS